MNKQFSIDSFLIWKGLHWVSNHLNQTTATPSLLCTKNWVFFWIQINITFFARLAIKTKPNKHLDNSV